MRQKRVTSLDVAERAGVSRTTVSLVLNNVNDNRISADTTQRVMRAAHELGYVPDAAARALASRRTGTIGVLFARSQPSQTEECSSRVLEALAQAAQAHGQHLLLGFVDDLHDARSYQSLLGAGQVDGLILSGPRLRSVELQELLNGAVPVVLLGSQPGALLPSVSFDMRAAAYEITTHLIQRGHTRIACLSHPPELYSAAEECLEGYHRALAAAGLARRPEWECIGPLHPRSGAEQMEILLALPQPPSAVFAAHDLLAYGALGVLQARGVRVPEQMALAGFGDLPLSPYVFPSLTSVHVPEAEAALRAADLLIELAQGGQPETTQVLFAAQVMLRAST